MKTARIIFSAILLPGLIAAMSMASTVFEDDFANGVVADSKSLTAYWTSGLSASAGDANAIAESGGTLSLTAGSNDGGDDSLYSGVLLYSAVSSNYNVFTKIRKFSVRGISFNDHSSGITNSGEQFRFALLSDGNNSYAADDALIVKTTPDGKIRLGKKQDDPGNNSDGGSVYEFTSLGSNGTYGFDLMVGPINGTSLEYQLEVYTGAVPVSAGFKGGSMSMTKANWGAGSGDAKMCLWAQEFNVTGGNQYFDATITNLLVEVDQNMLYNAGFELGNTSGWEKFPPPPNATDATLSMESTTVYDGAFACRVSNRNDTWHSVRRQVGGLFSTGETYTVSIWARVASGSASGAKLTLKTVDTAGPHYTTIDTEDLTSSGWTHLEGQVTFEYTGSLTESFFYVSNVPIGVDLLVDEASVVPYIELPQAGTIFVFQ